MYNGQEAQEFDDKSCAALGAHDNIYDKGRAGEDDYKNATVVPWVLRVYFRETRLQIQRGLERTGN